MRIGKTSMMLSIWFGSAFKRPMWISILIDVKSLEQLKEGIAYQEKPSASIGHPQPWYQVQLPEQGCGQGNLPTNLAQR